ncbi:MAG: glycosyltransferase family 2 protein [Gammaproteobacteria bacterium]
MIRRCETNSLPSLTVVIPSIARDRRLIETVGCLSRQDYPNWECIVVLQGAYDKKLAQSIHRVLGKKSRIFYLEEANASLARNVGLREAKGDVVLFLDDDVVIENPDFLKMHGRHYIDESVPGVAGQILGKDGLSRGRRHWLSRHPRTGWLYFPYNFNERSLLVSGVSANLSVRKDRALQIGGMDAQYEKGAHREESDFCLRLTARHGPLVFDPEAGLVHLGEETGGCRSWGANRGVHPLHHAAGEWYFILNNMRLKTILRRDLPHHAFALLRRQIFNRPNLSSPRRLREAVRRSCEGWAVANGKLSEGPRLIGELSAAGYREI